MNPIQAATVEREEGYWTHPDLPEWSVKHGRIIHAEYSRPHRAFLRIVEL